MGKLWNFDMWPAKWPLWCRLAATCLLPLWLVITAVMMIFGEPDRFNHAVGGAILFSMAWKLVGIVEEAIIYWPLIRQRNVERPAIMMALMAAGRRREPAKVVGAADITNVSGK